MAYGFRPVQMAGSRYQTGGFVKVPIEDDLIATAIYNGGPVAYTIAATTAATGLSANDTPLDDDLSCGILVGATWENSAGEQKWGNYYDATGVAGKSFAFIVPLDDVVFQIQGNAAWDRKYIGFECLTTGTTGSTITGNSNISLLQVTSDATKAVVIPIGVLENGNEDSSTPDVLVRFAAAGIQTKPLF
jgi:hypothetical protein|tara:strand:- start:1886 stop:2452 length:567 start_codon:yes stop_codon:yes gene_type:complete